MWKEFKAFAFKGNVVDLAVAVVIGKAFGDIISAVVAGLIMPVIGAVLPSGDWRAWEVSSIKLQLGHVLGALVDFLCVAFVLFLVVNKLLTIMYKREVPPPPNTKACPECLEQIPKEAKRCRACTSPLPA